MREREREIRAESPLSVCPGPGPQAGSGPQTVSGVSTTCWHFLKDALLDEAARKAAGHRAKHTCVHSDVFENTNWIAGSEPRTGSGVSRRQMSAELLRRAAG